MTEHPTHGDFLLGFEGLAIMRAWALAPETVRERARSIAGIVERRGEAPWAEAMIEREGAVRDGYASQAQGYPRPGNPVVLAEEPLVRRLLDDLPVGAALDAACGAGRYAHYLASLGHAVTGVDLTPEMLEEARKRVPAADFQPGDLSSLELPGESFDIAVCALALTHCTELGPPIGELARVVRPGGRVVISDVHPFMATLGLHSRFPLGQGDFGFVRNHIHQTSDYLAAFREAGLSVIQCREPLWGREELAVFSFTDDRPGLLEAAVEGLPIVIVWELEKA